VRRWRWTRRPDSAATNDPRTVTPTSELAPTQRSVLRGARFRLGRLRRRTAISLVLLAVVALAAASLLPLHQFRDQGKSIDRKKQVYIELQDRREELTSQLERARDQKVVERQAREQMSLVTPGDEIFRVVVPPNIINLPPGWHLPGVSRLVAGDS